MENTYRRYYRPWFIPFIGNRWSWVEVRDETIVRKKAFRGELWELSWDEVTPVVVPKKGLFSWMFGIGSVELQHVGGSVTTDFIKDAAGLKSLVLYKQERKRFLETASEAEIKEDELKRKYDHEREQLIFAPIGIGFSIAVFAFLAYRFEVNFLWVIATIQSLALAYVIGQMKEQKARSLTALEKHRADNGL